MEGVLQYIIPAAALIIVQLIVSFRQDKINNIKYDMTINAIKDDLKRLEGKQDKHNQLIERMVKIESSDDAQWHWIDKFKDNLAPTNKEKQ